MKWTEEKEILLLDEIILNENNICINIVELGALFNVTKSAICHRIMRLRKQHFLPPVGSASPHNPDYISYSNGEKKFIIGAHKAGLKRAEIAELTERSVSGISYIIGKLILSGEITPRNIQWSENDDAKLLKLVKLDSHGCVNNYPLLVLKLGISTTSIMNHLKRLRKAGKLPPVTGVSIKAIKAFRAGNERVFAKLA